MSLEAHFEDPAKSTILEKYPKFLAHHEAVDFLADSAKVLIVGGISAHDLEALMDEDLKAHHDEALKPASALTKIGDALPGLGIVAAVLGIVITMGHIDGPPAEIGHHVGAALVGTFLGILLSYGMCQPIAAIEQRVADEAYYCICIKAGLLAVYKGNPPAIAVEFARRVLPHAVRPSFNETEKFCKASASPAPARRQRHDPESAGHRRQENLARQPRPSWRCLEGGVCRLRDGDDGLLPRDVDRRTRARRSRPASRHTSAIRASFRSTSRRRTDAGRLHRGSGRTCRRWTFRRRAPRWKTRPPRSARSWSRCRP